MATDLSIDRIINVSITRQTTSVTQAGFGTPGIIAEFETSKTTPVFSRFRTYTSLTAMANEGWGVTDGVYKAAQAIFSQNPKVSKIMVGRKDSADASWSAALSAIESETSDWYGFGVIISPEANVVFSGDFVADNSIAGTVNGVAITPVAFTTDHATTMQALITELELITGLTATLDSGDVTGRTLDIEIFGKGVESLSFTVTGGSAQATATITYDTTSDLMEVAAWTETQTKIFGASTNNTDAYDSGSTADLLYLLQNNNYDRSFGFYSAVGQGVGVTSCLYPEFAIIGRCLPYEPGQITWRYKTLSGITTDSLTDGQADAIEGKNGNYLVSIGGVASFHTGQMASGEWIDTITGVDWIQARLQEAIYSELLNNLKLPYTSAGITAVEGTIRGVLLRASRQGIITEESIDITVPDIADISSTDKNNRLLPDVEFEATLQGAIHTITVSGTVSV